MQPVDAAVLNRIGGPFEIERLELEPPRRNEVCVELAGVGICHTDTKVAGGSRAVPVPVVLGHEGAGTVTDVGSAVTKVEPGDPVVMSFNSCGMCRMCLRGHPAVCDHFIELTFACRRPDDGSSPLHRGDETVHGYFFGQSSFATRAITTERNVVEVVHPDPLPLWALGPLGCGVQTGAGAVFNSLAVEPGTSLLVIGAGSVGLSAVMAAVVAGAATIVAVDRHPSRLQLAAELGATRVIDTAEAGDDLLAAVRDASGGDVDYALDTTNVPALVAVAIDCLHHGGTYGHIGGGDTKLTLDLGRLLAGRTVTGIVQGDSVPDELIPTLIELQADGRFPFERLITAYDFADINEAVAAMHAGTTIKPVLRMPAGPR